MSHFDSEIFQKILHVLPELKGSQRKVADYVLSNAFQAASSSIDMLARECCVSTASVNRFANALGYAGYGVFRQELLQAFRPSPSQLESLRHEVSRGSSGFEVAQASFSNAAELVEMTSHQFSHEGIERAVEAISLAKSVYCLGLGFSSLLADLAALRFTPYCGHIHPITRHGGQENAMYSLQKIGEGDLFVVLSFPRYSKESIHLTRFARSKGAAVLAITDRPSSPLVPFADHSLFAASSHPTLYISLVGAVSVLEAIASALAIRNPNVLEETAALTEQLQPYFYVENQENSSGYNRSDRVENKIS